MMKNFLFGLNRKQRRIEKQYIEAVRDLDERWKYVLLYWAHKPTEMLDSEFKYYADLYTDLRKAKEEQLEKARKH